MITLNRHHSLITTNILIFLFTLLFTFSPFDSNGNDNIPKIEVPGNTLAEKLTWLKSNAQNNGNYIITLRGNESLNGTDGKPNSVNTLDYPGKSKITITLIGESKECTINLKDNGSLFVVSAGVTLVLDKITLGGHINVSGGALIMKKDSKIIGRVSVDKGNFTMDGNASISASTASGRGYEDDEDGNGGVFLGEGTFLMNGSASISGGGVAVDKGNFTMDGNASISGGRVSIDKGTFTMNDSTSISGGGVAVSGGYDYDYDGGAFTMNGKALISGGEVYVYGGTFTMNGNTTISGGRVYVSAGYYRGGTFTMNGNSSISGNTASGRGDEDGNGGGVAVSGGSYDDSDYNYKRTTFTMNGNSSISGNTASRGGGVYVSGGTFTMKDNSSISSNTASSGGGVYVDGGTFNILGGTVYGSNDGEFSNKSTDDSNASAALYISEGTAKYKSGENWNYILTLGNNRETTIKVESKTVETPKVKLGELIGTVGGFDGAEVIVNGKDTIGRQAPLGRALIVDANGEYVYLQSTFPMQTVVKCKVTSGDRSKIKKGMKVYLKP